MTKVTLYIILVEVEISHLIMPCRQYYAPDHLHFVYNVPSNLSSNYFQPLFRKTAKFGSKTGNEKNI